ncbi:hypothetical protein NDU88_003768 [Pleurodeles waltl]|uniref:Secreted protein n=1 Tax=Pleurodeles waltl TaxID=8319 RepID=A0AAV7VGW0_PLEWA|nr:hypothetical protein NDU88_003768 [Pleurodeles waltl]
MVGALIWNKAILTHILLDVGYLHPDTFTLATRMRDSVVPQHGAETRSLCRSSGPLTELTHRGIFRWHSTQQTGLTAFICHFRIYCCVDREDRKF